MGLIDRIRRRAVATPAVQSYFKVLSAYSPAYSTYQGALYEMSLTRAAIHTFATHCAKLQPKLVGPARPDLQRVLQFQPNPLMDTYSFLYKLATILKSENTAFIIPLLDDRMRTIGFYPARSHGSEVKIYDGVQYLIYSSPLGGGNKAAVEFSKVGIMRNHFYKSDLYGEGNSALDTTLNMMYTIDQGITSGVQNSANIRFLARLTNMLKSEDVAKERQRFAEENLSVENATGVLIFDNKYADVKQIESKPLLVDPKQSELIQTNVYNYMGVNEDILQNKYDEDTWNAYYEGAIEPFAIQLSLVLTNMLFPGKAGITNSVMYEANRLQYASNTTKIQLVTQLFDRGFITTNQGLEIFNMAPVKGGDRRWIRGEYVDVNEAGKVHIEEVPDDQPGQTV